MQNSDRFRRLLIYIFVLKPMHLWEVLPVASKVSVFWIWPVALVIIILFGSKLASWRPACAPLHLQRGCAAKARPGLPAGIYGLALCPTAGSLVRSVLTTSAPQRHLWTINSDTQAEREATEPTHCQLVLQQCTCAKTSFSVRFRLAPRVLNSVRIFQWLTGGSAFFSFFFLHFFH